VGFQKKCIGKLESSAQEGRTVLFVSHNMAATQHLCERAILLDSGQIVEDGPTDTVLTSYLDRFQANGSSQRLNQNFARRKGNGTARIVNLQVLSPEGKPVSMVPLGGGIILRIEIHGFDLTREFSVVVEIFGPSGLCYCNINSVETKNWTIRLQAGQRVIVDCKIPKIFFGPREYSVWAALRNLEPPLNGTLRETLIDSVDNAASFKIIPADIFKTGRVTSGRQLFFPNADWDRVEISDIPESPVAELSNRHIRLGAT